MSKQFDTQVGDMTAEVLPPYDVMIQPPDNESDEGNLTSQIHGRDEHLAQIEILVQGLIFSLAVIGNGIVLVILLCR